MTPANANSVALCFNEFLPIKKLYLLFAILLASCNVTLAIISSDKNVTPVNLYDVIHNAVRCINDSSSTFPVTEINCDMHLTVKTGQTLLEHLFSHLFSNSLTHAFEDFAKGRVNIHVKLGDTKITLSFADNGRDLNEEQAKHLFAPFTTAARDKGGAGLGTNTISNIMTYGLEGNVTYYTILGEGLSYQIVFPAVVMDNVSEAS